MGFIAVASMRVAAWKIAPETELQCGVISNNIEHIQMDYRYGLEMGLDTLPKLHTLSADLAD